MSGQIRNIREIPGDSLAKFTNEISRRLSRFLTKNQIDQLEDREDIYTDGQDFDTVVKLHDNLTGTTKFLFDKPYYPPFEPDGDKLRLWLRGTNLGNTLKDLSSFDKQADLFGDPILVDGAPHDDGIKTGGVKSIALRMNRPTSSAVNDEYIQITDAPTLGIDGLSTGISYFIRFKIYSLALQEGLERTLFEKIEGPSVTDAVLAVVSTDGRLRFYVKRSGTWYRSQTATSTIALDTVYDVWFTHNVSGNVNKIYVNNLDKSLTDPGADPTLQSDTGNTDLWIAQRGKGDDTEGFFYGDIYDFRLYREKVVSATEIGRHFSNKWSISDIPFSQVMIANYWATFPVTPSACSYTSTSYTTPSWTACVVVVDSFTVTSFTATSFTV